MRIASSAAFVAAAAISASAAQAKKKPVCIKWGHQDTVDKLGNRYTACGDGLPFCTACGDNDWFCFAAEKNAARLCKIYKKQDCGQGDCMVATDCCQQLLSWEGEGDEKDPPFDCAGRDGVLNADKCRQVLNPPQVSSNPPPSAAKPHV